MRAKRRVESARTSETGAVASALVEVVPTAASVSASGGEDEMPTCRRAVQLCDAKCTLLDGETKRAVRRASHAARAKSRLSRKLRCEVVPIISMAVAAEVPHQHKQSAWGTRTAMTHFCVSKFWYDAQ